MLGRWTSSDPEAVREHQTNPLTMLREGSASGANYYYLQVGQRKLGQRLAHSSERWSDSKVRCRCEPRPCPVRFASKRIAMSSSALVSNERADRLALCEWPLPAAVTLARLRLLLRYL